MKALRKLCEYLQTLRQQKQEESGEQEGEGEKDPEQEEGSQENGGLTDGMDAADAYGTLHPLGSFEKLTFY